MPRCRLDHIVAIVQAWQITSLRPKWNRKRHLSRAVIILDSQAVSTTQLDLIKTLCMDHFNQEQGFNILYVVRVLLPEVNSVRKNRERKEMTWRNLLEFFENKAEKFVFFSLCVVTGLGERFTVKTRWKIQRVDQLILWYFPQVIIRMHMLIHGTTYEESDRQTDMGLVDLYTPQSCRGQNVLDCIDRIDWQEVVVVAFQVRHGKIDFD